MMRILVIGLGAIGRRHARNLRTLLGSEIDLIAFRARAGAATPDGCVDRTYDDLDEALSQRPVAALVCNPTSLHVPVATAAAGAGCHLLIEKPVSHALEGLTELKKIVDDSKLKALVGFQFRFHPGLAAVAELIRQGAIGRVTHATAHWGEYLPGWHPWEDYRESYSARHDLGGGVILTLCHPFDYLRWMLGEVRAVGAAIGRDGGLGIDVEDSADILLEFCSGAIAAVHLDYLQRLPSHRLEVVGDAGKIVWNNETGVARWYRADSPEWESVRPPDGFERNDMFLAEARHFLECVTDRAEPVVDLDDGVRTLTLALAAKSAAGQGRRIELPS